MQKTCILLAFVIMLIACKKETKTRDTDPGTDSLAAGTPAAAAAGFSTPELSEVNFDALISLRLQIERHPQDKSLREQYLQTAWFRNNKALISVGVGRLTHPETGQPVSRSLVKRAAQVDANRWAAYGASWIRNDLSPAFGRLDTTYRGAQTALLSYERGDSLYMAIASEIDTE